MIGGQFLTCTRHIVFHTEHAQCIAINFLPNVIIVLVTLNSVVSLFYHCGSYNISYTCNDIKSHHNLNFTRIRHFLGINLVHNSP